MSARYFCAAAIAAMMAAGPTLADETVRAPRDIALARNSMLLFGGPSTDYPRIGIITWGQGLSVLSCVPAADWCQVEADGQRGWVKSSKLTWGNDGKRRVMRKRISAIQLTL